MTSVVVLTHNNEQNIKECLDSLKFAGEIIIVDDNSTDKIPEIASSFASSTSLRASADKEKIKIFKRSLNNDFAAQRNFGLEKAKGEWVLFVDDDERVTPQLQDEILKAVDNKEGIEGFYFKREDVMWGTPLKHGETANVRILRLAKKGTGEWKRKVDETWEIKGKTATLKNPLLHYPHQTLTEFLESINSRSTLNAKVFYEEGIRTTFIDWFKPAFKFKQNYILRLGFLDGMPGFTVALLMSLHSFLVRSKLYLLWKQGDK
ncbi:MAG: glycosyltransferase family 2 protein [bacterium]|nr:glycosyltransferase family 2 protein [bacterium]